jgi:peptide subunit release factor 1 (eRF1)
MPFDIHDWQYKQRYALEELLQEEQIQFPLEGQNIGFRIVFYEGEGNFFYQFIASSNDVLDQIETIGKPKVIEEVAKFIESKTGLVTPYDEDAPGAGLNFKILPSELKDYMLSPFK